MSPPGAVLWDLDGTLVDSEPVHLLALTDALRILGVTPPSNLHQALLGASSRDVHLYCVATLGVTASYGDLSALKHEAYARHAGRLAPRMDAVGLFGRLRRHHVPQAIVSNSDRIVVDVNLRSLGLLVPDLVTVSRNDVRLGKPDAEPFLRAAYLLGIEPASCTVVEDSPLGAEAGLAAGMRVICFPEQNAGTPLAFRPEAIVARDGRHLVALLGLH